MFFKKKKNKNDKPKKDNLIVECEQLVENNQVKEAISKLEESIEKENKLGNRFSYLMKLYNIELKEARNQQDDDEIKKYLDKIDNLMKKSKDIVRGR